MNIKSIEYFLVTVEELNFTRAAERLFITQQALSSHIKRLETEYSVQLFERRPTIHLTPEGKQMAFYGRQMLESKAKMRAAFSDISQNCRGTLTVGISRLRGNVFFPLIWNYYHTACPNISVELVDGNSNRLDEMLQSGKIDLYIGIDVPSSPNRQRIELTREQMQCCISRELLERCRPGKVNKLLEEFQKGVDLTKIIDLPFITLRRNNRLRNGLEQFFSNNLNPHFIFESDQQGLIYELAKSGAGVGLASPVVFYEHIREITALKDSLHVFSISNDIPDNIVSLVYRKDYPLPRYAHAFIQASCMVFKNYEYAMKKGI